MREIKPLTGLRFIAAALVVLAHAFQTNALTQGGQVAMTMFFALSGFVLTWTYTGRLGTASGRNAYGWARFARIYPLCIITLALDFALHGITQGSGGNVLAHVLLLQAWIPDKETITAYASVEWSLSVEFFLYACLPLILVALNRFRPERMLWVAVGTVCVSVLMARLSLHGDPEGYWVRFFPPAHLPDFVMGCALARWHMARENVGQGWGAGALAAVSAIAALMLFGGLMDTSTASYSSFAWDAAQIAPVGLLVLALARSDGILAQMLSAPAALALGRASFALYLCHPFVLELSPYGLGVGVVLALLVSLAAHKWLENPFRRLFRHLPAREPQPAPT